MPDAHSEGGLEVNPHLIKRLYPHASASLLAANAGDYGQPHDNNTDHTGTAAKLERDPSNAPLEASEGKETHPKRILVRVIAVRKRALDDDNCCEKYAVDCLRFIGAIPDDAPDKVQIITTQRKAAKGEEERTIITITYPDSDEAIAFLKEGK